MILLDNLIAILAVKIFLKVDIWQANAIPFTDNFSLWYQSLQSEWLKKNKTEILNSTCAEMISREKSFLPKKYISKYNRPLGTTRDDFRRGYHGTWTCSCEGYVPSGMRCVPRCPRSCVKGTCKQPDVCTCNEGYRISIDGLGCVPECTKGCVNGNCIDPEVCRCNDGYWMDSDGFTCRPICKAECERNHGHCSEPNVCSCDKGYRKSNDSKELCVPECTNGCVNGICIGPEICRCNDGYWMDSDGFTCRPICKAECERNHGHCSEPNVCTCDKGYRKSNDSKELCVPECTNGCVNGICIGPESCGCHEGYWMGLNGSCLPICNIDCVQNHGYCSEPNVCKCNIGYRRIGDDSSPFRCELACLPGYGHGTNEDGFHICKPECNKPCMFGTCTKPGTCTCNHGYRAVSTNLCEPICSEPCVMGTCVAPESCKCNEGYIRHNNSSICEPTCETCANGECTASGLCICFEGFIYDEMHRTCKPHCSSPCKRNEECSAPNICTCAKGYHAPVLPIELIIKLLRDEEPFPTPTCEPVCDFNCINGWCNAPNSCSCYKNFSPRFFAYNNYTIDERFYVCGNDPEQVLSCDKFSCGDKATCHSKIGICICDDGYAMDTNDDCVPICAQTCYNGLCMAPNRCGCYDGFAMRNESFCEPICERGCQNGDCVAPNECVCHDDFIPNVNHSGPKCIPEDSRNCSGHGERVFYSSVDYKCVCHFGWMGEDCDQPSMCVIAIPYDHDDVNRITIYNDTNSTVMQVYNSTPYCKCNKLLHNETLCSMIQPDEGNTTFIGCLLSKDLPCYATSRYSVSINATKIVWPFVTIILLAIGLTAAAYFIYRKRQKEKLAIGPSVHIFMREPLATELLLE